MTTIIRHFDPQTGVGELRFNRPEVLNAINVVLAKDLERELNDLICVPGLRCLVLKGQGRAFMAGGDVGDFLAAGDNVAEVIRELLASLNPVVMTLRSLSLPVLAVAHGAVAGAGLSLLAACDIVLASEDAKFMMAYDKIGAQPDCGGSALLPLLVGERRATELMFCGAIWNAAQALDYGLINQVCAASALDLRANELARALAVGPTKAFGHYKDLRNSRLNHSFKEHLALEGKLFEQVSESVDFREGILAFTERRAPEFQGD
ncbi:enoyl-CoA hydratase-related protein [Spongiibacter taiwanensis]|uniref:enoyl-CoA hydratase/isomerase family protein n=1 Tax=Spongiibacter taiwanensis TaxID=1748242 RepID=UPI0020355695|nr:enoyl-CoA hydratase-related protein [Spongiibacter taiwanensis]USA42963.1 enoyl-CoA hydratase-related protein [Spongiibacter taiwanensis]